MSKTAAVPVVGPVHAKAAPAVAPTCGTCTAYESVAGECRRHAPSPMVGALDGRVMSVIWIKVPASEWCWEWVKKA